MMTKAMYHVPNMAIRNANFRLATHLRLNRLFPLFYPDVPKRPARKINYLILFLLVIFCICLLFFSTKL